MRLRAFRLTSNDIFTTLSQETILFNTLPLPSLLFYVNKPSVVIGRTQNPFNECYSSLPTARRRSGGGTVVHDLGNLNFCFMHPRSSHDPLKNANLVASTLNNCFSIPADTNSRADILLHGRKVGGAAYRITRDRAYHHGTLLINSDLAQLGRALKSPLRSGMKAGGAKSVRVEVTNLCTAHPELSIDDVIQAIAVEWGGEGTCVESIGENDLEGLDEERNELKSWDWVYGKTPAFGWEGHMPNGLYVHVKVGKSMRIAAVSCKDDPVLTETLTSNLHDVVLDGSKLLDRAMRLEGQSKNVALWLAEVMPAHSWLGVENDQTKSQISGHWS